MTFQFGGGGAASFTTPPTAGKPTGQFGTGTFGGGAAPDFQGISGIGLNMAAGYANNLIDLQVAGVSQLRVDSAGTVRGASGASFQGAVSLTGETLSTGAFSSATVVRTASYSIVGFSDFTVFVNAASLTVTLPSAVARLGFIYCIKNTSLGTGTTVASAAGTIDGAASDTTSLSAALAHALYQSDGTNWWHIA